MLIHFVVWHEYYVKILHSLLSGKKPELIKGTLKMQNKIAVEQNRTETVEKLLFRLKKAEEELEKIAKNPKTKEFRIAFKVGGKIRPLSEIIKLIPTHFKNHRTQLQKAGFVSG